MGKDDLASEAQPNATSAPVGGVEWKKNIFPAIRRDPGAIIPDFEPIFAAGAT